MDIAADFFNIEGGNLGEDDEDEEELSKDGRESVLIVRVLDLGRPGRGDVVLDASETADVDAEDEVIFGVTAGDANEEVGVELEVTVRMELLLC